MRFFTQSLSRSQAVIAWRKTAAERGTLGERRLQYALELDERLLEEDDVVESSDAVMPACVQAELDRARRESRSRA